MISDILLYFQRDLDTWLLAGAEHVLISLASLFFAVAIGIPAGFLSSRNQLWYRFSTTTFNTLRIVPSLAMIVVLIPVIGTGFFTAMIALVVLGIPPILLTTAAAFRTIPEFITDNALGMGMDRRQLFLMVKFPIALPLILTGVKTALVEIIASATLAAYIGGGGLGGIVLTGLGLNRTDLLFIGGASVAILSMIANTSMTHIQRRVAHPMS